MRKKSIPTMAERWASKYVERAVRDVRECGAMHSDVTKWLCTMWADTVAAVRTTSELRKECRHRKRGRATRWEDGLCKIWGSEWGERVPEVARKDAIELVMGEWKTK